MTFSDSLPIQFFGSIGFNENEGFGINHVCWCQPWECDDEIVIQFTDSIETPATEYELSIIDSEGTELHRLSFDYFELTETVCVYSVSFVPSQLSPEICNQKIVLKVVIDEQTFAKSDCLDIKSSHSDTKLFEYSNNRNFAGLIYADISPAPTFYLRVPCVFYHRRTQREGKAIERTSSTVVTSAKIKKQQLLQIKHAPDYFHEKVEQVLMHHNVEADGKLWKLEDAYEKDLNDIRQSLKKATVWLTEKNNLVRNVL